MKIRLHKFGEDLKTARKSIGMTRKALADGSGVTVSNLLKIENGTHFTSTAKAGKLLGFMMKSERFKGSLEVIV